MEISARIKLLASIKIGSVYYFEEEELSSSEPHYFIVLNKNPRTEEILILACASSQVEKRQKIAEILKLPKETLVVVSPAEYKLFTKDTVIDCNSSVFEKPTQSLIDKLEQGRLRICLELMPVEIVQRLIEGVMKSTQVSENIKTSLREE